MLMDHVTLDIHNIMSTAAVFLGIEENFEATWYSGLMYVIIITFLIYFY
jgi:hypothetical protein